MSFVIGKPSELYFNIQAFFAENRVGDEKQN